MVPELSVKSWRWGEGVQSGRRKKDQPFHGVANSCHHWRSSMKSPERGMTLSRGATEELRSIILLKTVLPAGTTLAAKLRVPIRDSSSR